MWQRMVRLNGKGVLRSCQHILVQLGTAYSIQHMNRMTGRGNLGAAMRLQIELHAPERLESKVPAIIPKSLAWRVIRASCWRWRFEWFGVSSLSSVFCLLSSGRVSEWTDWSTVQLSRYCTGAAPKMGTIDKRAGQAGQGERCLLIAVQYWSIVSGIASNR